MTHEDAGHYAAKHPSSKNVDDALVVSVKEVSIDGAITCVSAHKIADEKGVSPLEVGFTIDFLEVRINKCQLGLFGYSPNRSILKAAESVSDELEGAIRDALVNNRLSCARAWDIADRLSLPRIEVAEACEKLSIKMSQCQIGAFK